MKAHSRKGFVLCTALLVATPALRSGNAYPLDDWERTGIMRLEAYTRSREALLQRGTLKPGSLWPASDIRLGLSGLREFELPDPDPELGRRLQALLGASADRYGIAILDLTNLEDIRYIEHRGLAHQNPGSVGKLLVALAWLQALADASPDRVDRREKLLRDTIVTADEFIRKDDHTVPIYLSDTEPVRKRLLAIGDRGNLWTYMDWMLSSSSNAAASMLMQQLMLFRAGSKDYPASPEATSTYFTQTPRTELTAALQRALDEPIERAGLDRSQLRQGGFFTAEAKRRVSGGSSTSTPRELMRFLVRMEQGRLVDPWSSLELKRLLYITDRRIRYASHPVLNDAAVYFKSGSLYSCQPEEGFVCSKYHGNVRNFMNSVAGVETRGEQPLRYLVVVLSNVLRKNSAVDHQTLALRVHRMVEERHRHTLNAVPPSISPSAGAAAQQPVVPEAHR